MRSSLNHKWNARLLRLDKAWRGMSLQFIITISFMLITLTAIIFVSLILYNKFTRTAEQNTFLSNEQIVEQVKYNLEIHLHNMTQVFKTIDDKVARSGGDPDSEWMKQVGPILEVRSDIVSMALFGEDGRPILSLPQAEMRSNTRLTEQTWFRAALESPNYIHFSMPHIQNLYKSQYKWVVSVSKGIVLRRDGRDYRAVLLLDYNFRAIDALLSQVSLGKKGYVYIIDDSAGNIVYHPQQQLIYAGLKYENVEQSLKYTYGSYLDTTTGEKRLITINTVKNIGWKIIGVSYMDEIVTTRNEIGTFILWLVLFVILFVLFLAWLLSARISMPIKRLEQSMRKVEQGDFDIYLDIHGEDEVGRLSRRFNIMVFRIRELMEQIIHEQEEKRKGELEVLQAQINPHFLYNTLHSVVWLAGRGKSEEVITMITSLSKFFRISLSKGKHIISVQDELEHVRNYLIIQKMRYKRRFDFTISSEEAVLGCRTVKLIVQPIVENSIYHAMELMEDEGHIAISAERAGERVMLLVKDNGPGIPPDKLGSLLTGDVRSEEGSGVGLRNVHERIRLQFGHGYGIEIDSQLDVGTSVKIWIPYESD